jgi:uncharacterized repeat protein (TIGR01451 family)
VRLSLAVEQLESRLTPSINPAAPFELDGNVLTQSATTHDWDQVFADAGSPANTPGASSFKDGGTSGALAGTFIVDPTSTTADNIFTGGGSKDTNGIQAGPWLYTASKPQGKDDIAHAYAAAYIDSSTGHLLLYAGADRFDNSGDSTMGFWFYANQIGLGPISKGNGTGPFTGTHSTGDILLVSDFTVGGSVSTIAVYEWVGNDSTGHLVNITALGNPNTFATVNSAPISVPWSYTNKSGQTQPQAGEFLEEGVDLTALQIQGCFSTFQAETRSSQSPTATLSDFTLGGFPLCSLAAPQFTGLSKFDTFTNQGDFVTYPLTVQNTGAMPLYIQSVTDTLLGNIVVNHVVQLPVYPVTNISPAPGTSLTTALAPGASMTILVTRQVQASDPDPTPDTVTFVGTDDLAGTEDPITASVTNSVNLFQPSATLAEIVSPTAGVVGTPITYTFTVTNTSSADSPNLVLGTPTSFLNDNLFPNLLADAIAAMPIHPGDGTGQVAPGGSFTFTETRTLQSGDPTPLTDATSGGFTLVQSALFSGSNVIHASASASVNIVDAQISIAPNGINEVNNPHTFTVTVLENLGDGNGLIAAANVPVTVKLTNTNGSTTSPTTYNVTTDTSGHASVTFTSATAGKVIGNASTTFNVLGVPLTRSTGDGVSGDSGAATKFFEDANISIAPNATNGISEPHTFTVTVLQNAGDGNGYVAAANVPVTITLTGQNGAVPIPETPLSGHTNASGQFAATFTSDSAGHVLGNASTTFTLNGVTLTRATSDTHTGDSGPATKTFVAGKILWKKVDEAGNLLGGATFKVTATGGTAASLSPTSVTVLDNGPFDANPANGLFELDAFQSFGGSNLTGLALGTYTIQEITPPSGYTLDPRVLTVTLTQSVVTGDVTGTPFVDTLPNLSIVKTVTANHTVIHPGDTASFTITVSNPGAGTANNVVMTDQLPDPSQLSWAVTSFTGFASASISSSGVLTATDPALLGGASASIVVSAVVPTDFFGTSGSGTGNGDSVPLTLFELDGNATTGIVVTPNTPPGSTTPSHDWDQVFADNTANPITNTAGALASSFVTDVVNSRTDDIYTGGGSKDTLGIQRGPWLFTDGKPQGKDDITHAFAAMYKEPITGDQVLYAGLDRFDNSGDSTAGFWFFVNPIGEGTISKSNGTGPFTGTHTDGDILLVSDFTIGGSVSTIRVFKWVGNDSTGHLVALNNGNPINGSTFAIVNGSPISVPWSYTNKSGASQPAAGEFLEEGVNLTGLGLNGCFSSFLAETRSSQSPTATLSDFVLGNFDTCDVQLPNQASVSASNFDNGQPITSNTVTIDLNDGMAQLAASVRTGVSVPSLTMAQLQRAVADAIAAWRAAGANAADLRNLANYTFHIAQLPTGELGYEVPGQIWIDATADGWGWSTGTKPVPGKMDLRTVVSHEIGHVLGLSDLSGGNDVMTDTLMPGVRRLPGRTYNRVIFGRHG